MEVFISSAMEELECEREIAVETVKSLGLEPIYFEGHAGVCDPLTESLRLVDRADIVIVIIWKRYSKFVEEEYKHAFSSGKPIIILEKTINEKEKKDHELKIFIDKIKNKHTYKSFRKLSDLRLWIIYSIQEIFYKSLHFIRRFPEDEVRSIIRGKLSHAKEIYALSRTPILLFGPRPYLSDSKLREEEEGYKLMLNLRDSAIKGERKFILIVLSHLVIKELESQDKNNVLVKKVLENLRNLKKSKSSKFKLVCTSLQYDLPPVLTYIVTDDTAMLWNKTHGTNYCILIENKDVATSIKSLLENYQEKDYTQELINKLEGWLENCS